MTAVIPVRSCSSTSPSSPDRQVLPRLPGRQPAGGQLRRSGHWARCPRSPRRSPRCRQSSRTRSSCSAPIRDAPRRKPRRTPRHVLRGGLGAQGRRSGAAVPELGAHAADLHLRRARRLLRPRAAAGRDPTRRHRAQAPGRATPRAATTSTARAFRPSSSLRTRDPAASPTSSTITPRSWRRSRASGTCRR